MVALDNYQEILRKLEKLKSEYEQLKGQLAQLKKQLKSDYKVDTYRAAKKLLDRLKKRETNAYEKYVKAKKYFERKWGRQLDLPLKAPKKNR